MGTRDASRPPTLRTRAALRELEFDEGTAARIGLAVETIVATLCLLPYLRWHGIDSDLTALRSNDA